ncbi:hypothetical protein HAX54_049466, partial [Datura stramonium]|nr:hypothetical protein [Datura stramonium]
VRNRRLRSRYSIGEVKIAVRPQTTDITRDQGSGLKPISPNRRSIDISPDKWENSTIVVIPNSSLRTPISQFLKHSHTTYPKP